MKYCTVLHSNFEDIEALSFIDILRRAGVELDIYGIGSRNIISRSKITYTLEHSFSAEGDIDVSFYSGILIPGGPGTYELVKNTELLSCIKSFHNSGKLIFAICAAPLLLDRAGILSGKTYTCFPGTEIAAGTRSNNRVVVDGNIVTSQGVGTALEAALKLVEIIVGKDAAASQAKNILFG